MTLLYSTSTVTHEHHITVVSSILCGVYYSILLYHCAFLCYHTVYATIYVET